MPQRLPQQKAAGTKKSMLWVPSRGAGRPTPASIVIEADADKQQLRSMLTALDAAGNQMRLDECRTWTIRGKRGFLATWGDGQRWLIFCSVASARKWNRLRMALASLGRCTQDGDYEGIISHRRMGVPRPVQPAGGLAGELSCLDLRLSVHRRADADDPALSCCSDQWTNRSRGSSLRQWRGPIR
jgi:hypothetical protein